MWIVCITSVRHVLTVNGYGGRQTKENEKSWCFKGWETLVSNNKFSISFGVKGFFPFPFSIVMQIYAHLFCLSLSNCRLIVFIDKTTNR